jgi:hypothetical protein
MLGASPGNFMIPSHVTVHFSLGSDGVHTQDPMFMLHLKLWLDLMSVELRSCIWKRFCISYAITQKIKHGPVDVIGQDRHPASVRREDRL